MAEPQKVVPFQSASGGKKEWPSLCQQRSETYVPTMDLVTNCVALFTKVDDDTPTEKA